MSYALWHDRGNYIYVNLDKSPSVERYVIDDVVVDRENPRPCPRCGKHPTKDGVDACIGRMIPGLRSTCCGHGVDDPIMVTDGGVSVEITHLYKEDIGPEQYPVTPIDPIVYGIPKEFSFNAVDHFVQFQNDGIIWCKDGENIDPYFVFLPDGDLGQIAAQMKVPRDVEFKDSGLYEYLLNLQAIFEKDYSVFHPIVQIPDIRLAYMLYDHFVNQQIEFGEFWTSNYHKKTGTGYSFHPEGGLILAPLNAILNVYPIALVKHGNPKNLIQPTNPFDIYEISTFKEDE